MSCCRPARLRKQKPSSISALSDHNLLFSSSTDAQGDDSLKFVSHFKSPIVQKLWIARQKAKDTAAASTAGVPSSVPVVPRQSRTSISYPFTSNPLLKESYRNPWGQVRFGKILEDLDALAGNIGTAEACCYYIMINSCKTHHSLFQLYNKFSKPLLMFRILP
jgi:hypothetical protein